MTLTVARLHEILRSGRLGLCGAELVAHPPENARRISTLAELRRFEGRTITIASRDRFDFDSAPGRTVNVEFYDRGQ